MSYHTKINAISNIAQARDLKQVRAFLHLHGEALAEAAHMLGGRAASGRVYMFIDAVRDAARLTKVQRRQLVDFHKLLTPENVGDPERVETSFFAQIDPASDSVHACCLLAERLEELLSDIATGEDSNPPLAAHGSGAHQAA